jgi:hypothetical protein
LQCRSKVTILVQDMKKVVVRDHDVLGGHGMHRDVFYGMAPSSLSNQT